MREAKSPTPENFPQRTFTLDPPQAMTSPNSTPLSIDRAARELDIDRRRVASAMEDAQRLDFIAPVDLNGTRGTPRWTLAQCCEAVEMLEIRRSKHDRRRWCERLAADLERALAMPCPRCAGLHEEMPIMPLPGRTFPPAIADWHRENNFPERYPEAGPDHSLF